MQDQKAPFYAKVKKTLTDHGFPQKKVTLPLEKMYEVAEEKKINFNDILDELASEGIFHKKLPDKILFYAQDLNPSEEGPFSSQDQQSEAIYKQIFDRFKGMDPQELMKNAQNILQGLSPEELQKMQELYQKMSPQDREELAKKAKDFGF